MILKDLLGTFVKQNMIDKGGNTTRDKKFRVETKDGEVLFLRVYNESLCEKKSHEFDFMRKAEAAGVLLAQPVKIGTFANGGGYTLTRWLDGKTADEDGLLYSLPGISQYLLGRNLGENISKLHNTSTSKSTEKIDLVQCYSRIIENIPHDNTFKTNVDAITTYFEKYKHLLQAREAILLHGDLNLGNFILDKNKYKIIDFEHFHAGDPWDDLKSIVYIADKGYSGFSNGVLNGYFEGDPPEEFWILQSLFVATHVTIYATNGWLNVGESRKYCEMLHENDEIIPKWYIGENEVFLKLANVHMTENSDKHSKYRIQMLEKWVAEMENSKSWKITEPFRKMAKKLKKL